MFSDQYGIQRSTTQELVTANKEFQTFITENKRLSQSSNLDIVLMARVEWHGILVGFRVVDQIHTDSLIQNRTSLAQIDCLFGLQHNHFRMSSQSGNADGRACQTNVFWQLANLLSFPNNFHFLLGVSILLELVDVRDDIEWKGMNEYLIGGYLIIQQLISGSLQQFLHARLSSTRCSLISRDHHFRNTKFVDQRGHCHQSDRSGTIRVGNQFGRSRQDMRIDFGNDKGNVGIISKS
mmetsp:Transcript_128587/g.372091  ORF Transcript_128587/g.372091 Transcript_128587/m.372091 type:complete len:237 (-) Transcript_128587:393-1103(-)